MVGGNTCSIRWEERNSQHHIWMKLGEAAQVAIKGGITLVFLRIFPFNLHGTKANLILYRFGDDKIKTLVSSGEVDIPAIVGKDARNVHFSEVISCVRLPYCHVEFFA